MLNQRITAANEVADLLFAAERSSDAAIIASAKLAAGLLEARLKLNLAACVGHEVIEGVAANLAEQVAGRRHLVDAHARLADVQQAIGLRTLAFGGAGDKAVPAPTGVGGLTLVRAAA